MNHYTYEIRFKNGMKYLGVRSCLANPEDDTGYLGSSKIIPPELYETCVKTILGTFETRVEAVQDEIRRHKELDIALNPIYYNQVKQTSVGFDQAGTTKESHDHIRAMAEKLEGRTRQEFEYLDETARKNSTRRGSNRTEKQKAADLKMRDKETGPNPRKGNTGSKSPKYKPWYYITPEGEYNEVYTSIRNFVNTTNLLPGVTYNSITRAVHVKGHTPMLRGKMRGYVFGYLHSKPEYLTQENIALALKVLMHMPFVESPNKEAPIRPPDYNPISNITGKK